MKSFATLLAIGTLFISQAVFAQTYTWEGSSSNDFGTASNWTPWRLAPLATDKLVFAVGGTVELSNIPTQTLMKLSVTGNTQLILSASTTNKVITISNGSGTGFLVENGSSLTFKNNGGVQIDVEMGANTTAEIGGTVTMEKGIFDVNNGTLTLHTNTNPLQSVSGKFSMGSGSTLIFGKTGSTPEGQIVLPNDIFVGNPAIGTLVMNSADGAKLGNQSLTVVNSATFTAGNLYTNNLGKLIFSTTASLPVENQSSKIIGFAQMNTRAIGTSAVSFLGYSIASGLDDLGDVSIERTTGPAGINFNDGHESIAVTWDVTVENQPTNGRDVTMQWFEEFDNFNDVLIPMQMYRYVDGTEWEVVGGSNEIASNVEGLRTSATVFTNHFSEWTISSVDNALPVSLTNFEGSVKNGQVVLNWTTASELNNDRFIVERLDGDTYQYVGSIKGNGTTTEVNNYEFVDMNPKNGNNYYRLTQQDFDGKTTVYEAINVSFTTISDFQVYPNPSNGSELQVIVDNTSDEQTSVKLYDAHGTLILEKMAGGLARVDVLDGKQLSRGLYYVELVSGGSSNKRRVIIN